MKRIVITNEKGGTGKSTFSCLLTEYLNFKGYTVQLLDTDPLQASADWVQNCQAENRIVSITPASYLIIDTAGSGGSALSYLKQADFIIVPFQAHYVDLKVTINWFDSLRPEWKQKLIFVPNRWQNTKEQRDGLHQLQQIIQNEKLGQIVSPLANRPAFYGSFLGGSSQNLFQSHKVPTDLLQLMETLLIVFSN